MPVLQHIPANLIRLAWEMFQIVAPMLNQRAVRADVHGHHDEAEQLAKSADHIRAKPHPHGG
jgi:hypothetical protein